MLTCRNVCTFCMYELHELCFDRHLTEWRTKCWGPCSDSCENGKTKEKILWKAWTSHFCRVSRVPELCLRSTGIWKCQVNRLTYGTTWRRKQLVSRSRIPRKSSKKNERAWSKTVSRSTIPRKSSKKNERAWSKKGILWLQFFLPVRVLTKATRLGRTKAPTSQNWQAAHLRYAAGTNGHG